MRAWLKAALSENGEPSARRLVMVLGLLLVSPILLSACLVKAPEQFGLAFEVWVAICGGVYVGGTLAGRSGTNPTTPTP